MKLGVEFKPRLAATPIGSLPYVDPVEAVDAFLRLFPEVPAWPQLPKRDPSENMIVQYGKTMPGACWDGEHLHFTKDGDFYAQLEKVFEVQGEIDAGITETPGVVALDPEAASGFYEFMRRAGHLGSDVRMVKGHITGPVSFELSAVDQDKKPIFYDDELALMATTYLALAARWQAQMLQKLTPRVCIFIDEPMMSSYGSAFYSGLNEQSVATAINEVAGAIHAQNAYAGIHAGCAGTTDWGLLLRTDVDVLNFDAYEHFETFTLYPDELNRFIGDGGILAWGLAPNDERIAEESVTRLVSRFHGYLDWLNGIGLDRQLVVETSMITPACGVGGRDRQTADQILQTTVDVARALREQLLD